MSEARLWSFFREVRSAVARGKAGEDAAPYRHGDFMVLAEAEDTELTLRDVSEEDAVLIAGELRELGARAVVRALVSCPNCGRRAPEQAYCVACRAPMAAPNDAP